jgi:transcriptional regulator with XRE-family HTH domain
MNTPDTFGEYVTEARERQNFSKKHLAKQLGIELTTISRIESGSTPGIDTFLALVDALHLDLIAAIELIEPYKRLHDRITAQQERESPHG